jgi:hypothetical protein
MEKMAQIHQDFEKNIFKLPYFYGNFQSIAEDIKGF